MARQKLWKGMLAGSAAGLAGTIAMTQFQNLWKKASSKLESSGAAESSNHEQHHDSEGPTEKLAGKVAERAGYRLSPDQRSKAGPIVHYGFGTAMGALYGGIMELGPRDLRRHELWSGIGFGSMLFAGADEITVPAMGLSKPAQKMPVSLHLYALASHVVYGATAGVVRKTIRGVL
ncbi:MAG: DUF1440 domain-containing protein [Acidobacteria bacterium]|nr:DUF1440 domain-containing protein [Acidobacteriota bacterium]